VDNIIKEIERLEEIGQTRSQIEAIKIGLLDEIRYLIQHNKTLESFGAETTPPSEIFRWAMEKAKEYEK
jgi:hypothetical protein